MPFLARPQPENILIGLDGHVKLADFGSAKLMRGRVGETPPPPSNHSLVGTPEYMAPEVLMGQLCSETSDWWRRLCLRGLSARRERLASL